MKQHPRYEGKHLNVHKRLYFMYSDRKKNYAEEQPSCICVTTFSFNFFQKLNGCVSQSLFKLNV